MLWTGTAVAVVALMIVVSQPFASEGVTAVFDAALSVLITAVPFAFLLGLMRSTLSRAGAVSELFQRLGGESARDALAEALGDDTLTLAYRLPDQRRYVDAQGHTVVLPQLFGEPEAPMTGRNVAKVLAKLCVKSEFTKLALGRTAPVATWLRSLAREADYFLVATRCAKHMATECIDQNRKPGGETLFATGKGSSSLLAALYSAFESP